MGEYRLEGPRLGYARIRYILTGCESRDTHPYATMSPVIPTPPRVCLRHTYNGHGHLSGSIASTATAPLCHPASLLPPCLDTAVAVVALEAPLCVTNHSLEWVQAVEG